MELKSELLAAQAISIFASVSENSEYLKFCEVKRGWGKSQEEIVLIINCPSVEYRHLAQKESKRIIQRLWEQRHILVASAALLGLSERLIFKLRGCLFGSASSQNPIIEGCTPKMILASTANSCSYGDLLIDIANSKYPAFVVEVPQRWHWGQPQKCFLTSTQVSSFSGRKAPKWHGDDVTLLYDRQVFEKMHDNLTREFESNGGSKIILRDYEYRSYTVDPSREQLCRDREHEYQSDIEMRYLQDLDMLVRICYCKERRPL